MKLPKMKILLATSSLAILLGALFGAALPSQVKDVEAATWHSYYFRLPVPASEGVNATNSCGWHTNCSSSSVGEALDWTGGDGGVRLRGVGVNGTTSIVTSAWAYPYWSSNIGSECYYNVRLAVYEVDTWELQFIMEYTHTGTGGPSDATSIAMQYRWNDGYGIGNSGVRFAGYGYPDPDPDCDIDGAHVHVERIAGYDGSTYYANNPNGTNNDPFTNDDFCCRSYNNNNWTNFLGFWH